MKSNGLLIEIVKKVGGDVYISGLGGKKYIVEEEFKRNNIELEYYENKPFAYSQRWDGFEPYMSSIDPLFNMGDDINNFIHSER